MMSPSHEHRKELLLAERSRLDLPPLLAGADKIVRSADVCGWHL
jgi:hypothetical protein